MAELTNEAYREDHLVFFSASSSEEEEEEDHSPVEMGKIPKFATYRSYNEGILTDKNFDRFKRMLTKIST